MTQERDELEKLKIKADDLKKQALDLLQESNKKQGTRSEFLLFQSLDTHLDGISLENRIKTFNRIKRKYASTWDHKIEGGLVPLTGEVKTSFSC